MTLLVTCWSSFMAKLSLGICQTTIHRIVEVHCTSRKNNQLCIALVCAQARCAVCAATPCGSDRQTICAVLHQGGQYRRWSLKVMWPADFLRAVEPDISSVSFADQSVDQLSGFQETLEGQSDDCALHLLVELPLIPRSCRVCHLYTLEVSETIIGVSQTCALFWPSHYFFFIIILNTLNPQPV